MDMLGLVVRLVFSLAIVVGLLLLLARFAGKRFTGRLGAPVQVIHRQPLSRGSSVSIVSVGTRILVLGATEQQVTLLTELEPDELDLDVPDPADADAPDRGSVAPVAAAAGPLAGSLLSPQTWRQALAAATAKSAGSTGPAGGTPSPLSEKQAS